MYIIATTSVYIHVHIGITGYCMYIRKLSSHIEVRRNEFSLLKIAYAIAASKQDEIKNSG